MGVQRFPGVFTGVATGIGLYHHSCECRALMSCYGSRLTHRLVSEPSTEASVAWLLITREGLPAIHPI